jgi:hypothetical protein
MPLDATRTGVVHGSTASESFSLKGASAPLKAAPLGIKAFEYFFGTRELNESDFTIQRAEDRVLLPGESEAAGFGPALPMFKDDLEKIQAPGSTYRVLIEPERAEFKVHKNRQGLLCRPNGTLIDTTGMPRGIAIYTEEYDTGDLYIGEPVEGRIHHFSFLRVLSGPGEPLRLAPAGAAGEVRIVAGRASYANPVSGHNWPSDGHFARFIRRWLLDAAAPDFVVDNARDAGMFARLLRQGGLVEWAQIVGVPAALMALLVGVLYYYTLPALGLRRSEKSATQKPAAILTTEQAEAQRQWNKASTGARRLAMLAHVLADARSGQAAEFNLADGRGVLNLSRSDVRRHTTELADLLLVEKGKRNLHGSLTELGRIAAGIAPEPLRQEIEAALNEAGRGAQP